MNTQPFRPIGQMIELRSMYLSGRYIWLYLFITSRTTFRVNPHAIVCLNVKEILAWSKSHIWGLSEGNEFGTHNHLGHK